MEIIFITLGPGGRNRLRLYLNWDRDGTRLNDTKGGKLETGKVNQ